VIEHKQYGVELVDFIIEIKDGTKTGWAAQYVSSPNFGWNEIGYAIVSNERNTGCATEATQIPVDHLFLTREIVRVQAVIDVDNAASRRVLEKACFRREGVLRKALSNAAAEWADALHLRHHKRGLERAKGAGPAHATTKAVVGHFSLDHPTPHIRRSAIACCAHVALISYRSDELLTLTRLEATLASESSSVTRTDLLLTAHAT